MKYNIFNYKLIQGFKNSFKKALSNINSLTFFFFGYIDIWTRGFMLARQVLYHFEPFHQPFFGLGIFQDRVSHKLFAWASYEL
jgi:hypothetical protein